MPPLEPNTQPVSAELAESEGALGDPPIKIVRSEIRGGGRELYAALDLGTNSCRMLIAEPCDGHFRIVDAFSKSVRLGEDLERTGTLSSSGISRTLQALQVCATKLRRAKVTRTRLVATEACRRATNGRSFLKRARNETGLALEVIRPQEEARLAVISCAPLVDPSAKQVLVIDIGGGSTELVWIDVSDVEPTLRSEAIARLRVQRKDGGGSEPSARLVDWISVPLGVATLHERFSDVESDAGRFALMSWYFEEQIAEFKPYASWQDPGQLHGLQMIGTSGTVTTIGAAHLGLPRYDRTLVDGMRMAGGDIDAVIEEFLALGPEGRIRDGRIGADRVDLIMSGAAILQTLLRLWPTDFITVADRGLREGILFSLMSEDGRMRHGR